MFEEIKNLYRKYPERCCITLVILAAVLPFLPALSFGTFIFDDSAYIGQEFLFSLSWRNLKYHLTSETVGLHSPLVMLSFIPPSRSGQTGMRSKCSRSCSTAGRGCRIFYGTR